MASWTDVERIALALPETSERADHLGLRSWAVRDLMFAWERPLRKSELEALSEPIAAGPILGVRVADLTAKRALLANSRQGCFTTPHFDGYSTVLVRLDEIGDADLWEVIIDAWLARAPSWLVGTFLASE